MKPASQTMLKLPVQAADLPAKYADTQGYIPYDPAKATQLLDAAGYKMGADGQRTRQDGKPLDLVFSLQAGYIDYIALADTVTRNWRALGIDIKMVTTDPDAVTAQKKAGDFDVVLEYVGGGCTRSREWGTRLNSSQINPEKSKDLLRTYRATETRRSTRRSRSGGDHRPGQDQGGLGQAGRRVDDRLPGDRAQLRTRPADLPERQHHRLAEEEKPYALDNMLYVITQIRPK